MDSTSDTLPKTFLEAHARTIFLITLFIVVFISVRLVIRPINETDYQTFTNAGSKFLHGESMYTVKGYYMPSWSGFFLIPLVNQPIETWLALDVALFVAIMVDLGGLSGILLLLHPAFLTLIFSANPEWLIIGPGLWLLYHDAKGWKRGLAWLMLTCKPQTTVFLLLFDGWNALRQRDYKAIGVAGIVALGSFLFFYPQQFLQHLIIPLDWSATVLAHYGPVVAVAIALIVVVIRWKRLRTLQDQKTLGLLFAPILSPYMLEYSYTAIVFTMRKAGWIRTSIYVLASIGLAYLFWRDYHVAEQVGALGMVLLAALLAPAYRPESDEAKTIESPQPAEQAEMP